MSENSVLLQEAQAKIRNYAVGLLAKRDYAVRELQDKLARKFEQESAAVGQNMAAQTVAWLVELGYLNDANYCAMFIRSSIAKGRGRLRIEQELRQKQLATHLIAEAVNNAAVDWYQHAYDTLTRKFKLPPQDIKEKAKVIRYLQYRGFVPDEIFTALDQWQALVRDESLESR